MKIFLKKNGGNKNIKEIIFTLLFLWSKYVEKKFLLEYEQEVIYIIRRGFINQYLNISKILKSVLTKCDFSK